MGGKGRGAVLAVRAEDPVLSLAAPIGMAASRHTALLVDMTGESGAGSRRTLGDIENDGPGLSELSPGRSGVAFISSGDLGVGEAFSVLERLADSWPAIVVRLGIGSWPGPVVPVKVLYPGWLAPRSTDPAVWQPVPGSVKPPGPGPVLPRLNGHMARKLVSGSLPFRSRWVGAWTRVWELPWA